MDDSFGKGLRVIEVLASSEQPLTLTQLAEQTGLIKSHCHKFLRTLIERHYAEQVHDRGPYRLTFKLWELGVSVLARADLVAAARQPMRDLTAATGETSTIAVCEGADAIYIYKVEGTQEVRTSAEVGRHRPVYCVAAGKAILAFQPMQIVDAATGRMKRHTARTIVTKTAMLEELAAVRKRGYAVNWGEWVDSVRGIAAPIFGIDGHVVAALNLSIPAERLDKKAAQRLGPAVVECAARISRSLGYLRPGARSQRSA